MKKTDFLYIILFLIFIERVMSNKVVSFFLFLNIFQKSFNKILMNTHDINWEISL